jgi:glycosyltransferase involved in cell wall biosynthesis
MDFAVPPPDPDDYAKRFRADLGLQPDDLLVLQPTRVVARKGIEHAVELARRIDRRRVKLIVTHASGDEGDAYARRIRDIADYLGVDLRLANERIAHKRGTDGNGRRIYSIGDAYSQADLVTYPSEYEGFGNAFLEAVYFKKPVLCNRYTIFRTDLEPCGFRPILFEGYLTSDTLKEVNRVLTDEAYRSEMVEHNYQVAARFFGFHVVKQELQAMLLRPQNIYRLLNRVRRGTRLLRRF